MAKKLGQGKASGDDGGAERMIGVPKLKGLISAGKDADARQKAAGMKFAEAVEEAAERDNLHRGAFAAIRKVEKMEPHKMRAWLAHFDYMRDALNLDERKGRDLFDKTAEAGREGGKPQGSKPAKDAKGERADEQQLAGVGKGREAKAASIAGTPVSRSALAKAQAEGTVDSLAKGAGAELPGGGKPH